MVLGVYYLVEIPYRKCLCHIEINQMICFSNQLTWFYMIQVFVEWYFRTDAFTVWSRCKWIQLLVRTLTSFQFSIVSKRRFGTLSQCLKPSITKRVISYSLVQIFNKVFQYILKSLGTILIRNYFSSNAKNANKKKKKGTNFELTAIS